MDSFLYTWTRPILTSLGFKVGDSVHDDMMQEQRLVVDFYVSGQKAIEVLHISAETGKSSSEYKGKKRLLLLLHLNQTALVSKTDVDVRHCFK